MKRRLIGLCALIAAAGALVAIGCGGDKEPAQGAGASQVKDEDLATKADFEDEAEKAITEANYKNELDSIEKEIGQ